MTPLFHTFFFSLDFIFSLLPPTFSLHTKWKDSDEIAPENRQTTMFPVWNDSNNEGIRAALIYISFPNLAVFLTSSSNGFFAFADWMGETERIPLMFDLYLFVFTKCSLLYFVLFIFLLCVVPSVLCILFYAVWRFIVHIYLNFVFLFKLNNIYIFVDFPIFFCLFPTFAYVVFCHDLPFLLFSNFVIALG